MTSTIRRANFRTEGVASVSGNIRAWLKRRRDQRIIDGLSQEQLKDIGYHRLPSGEVERNWW